MRLLLMGLLTLVIAAPASAADITVTTRLDSVSADGRCSLREAVTAANTNAATGGCPAGTVAPDVIVLGDGHYLLSRAGAREDDNATGDLDLVDGGQLTMRGLGRDRTVVSGEGLDRVVDVLGGAGVTIADLAIAGGAAPDGADGAPGANAGGAGEHGGGIRSDGRLTLRDSAVRGNRAGRGGAGGNGSGGVLGGAGGAGGDGGGIYSISTLTLIRTRVVDNRSGASGQSGSAAFVGTHSVNPGGDGGGIAAHGLTTVTDSVVEANRAGAGGDGGGAGIAGGNGAAGGDGGAIVVSVPASIEGSTIARNVSGAGGRGGGGSSNGGNGGAGGDGGGVYATGQLAVRGTLLTGNGTGEGGAGGNGAQNAGNGGAGGNAAGLIAFTGSDVDVESSTLVAGTTGPGGPGGAGPLSNGGPAGFATAVYGVGGVSLARTIATGDCDGTVGDGGENLGTHFRCPVTLDDPLVDANGMPGAGSPAIDAATTCPTVDLAGTSRPQGAACDIGALEVPAAAAAVARTGLDFGPVTTGGAATRSVDVINPGLPGLVLPIAVTGGSEFTLAAHTCGALLPGGAACAVTVRFAPTALGARTGTLQIGNETLDLTGTGVAPQTDPPNNNPPQATARCLVPRLKGKTVVAAARALQQADCRLGTVTRRGRGRRGRVRSFSPKAGTSLPAGTTVRLVLNRRPRR
jgi:CSLREA domain-containing protein